MANSGIPTLHAPHGSSTEVAESLGFLDEDSWPCPKCTASFPALFALNKHVRDKHSEPKGLVR